MPISAYISLSTYLYFFISSTSYMVILLLDQCDLSIIYKFLQFPINVSMIWLKSNLTVTINSNNNLFVEQVNDYNIVYTSYYYAISQYCARYNHFQILNNYCPFSSLAKGDLKVVVQEKRVLCYIVHFHLRSGHLNGHTTK